MAWLRLDDGFAQHPKVVALTPRDRWTWLELLCYCARYRTDGKVPAGTAEVVRGATPAFLARALELGLLEPVPGTTSAYQVHDFHEYNPPRIEDVDEAVAAYLNDTPDASANSVWKAVGGSRNAVLAAVRRYRTGTEAVPGAGTQNGTDTGIARASRPVPSRTTEEEPPAAALATVDAAAAAERLKAIGLEVSLIDTYGLELVIAWLDVADREAQSNPAGFVLTGLRTGQPPSPRVTTVNGTTTDYTTKARELYERTRDVERVADWLAGLTRLTPTERETILDQVVTT